MYKTAGKRKKGKNNSYSFSCSILQVWTGNENVEGFLGGEMNHCICDQREELLGLIWRFHYLIRKNAFINYCTHVSAHSIIMFLLIIGLVIELGMVRMSLKMTMPLYSLISCHEEYSNYTRCWVPLIFLRQRKWLFQELNAVLALRSYFVGSSQTLADIVLYYVLHGVMVSN